jgi:serine/alanine adding enzyme
MNWIINPKGEVFEKWKVFVSEHEQSNFFQSYEFVKLYQSNGYTINTFVAFENEKIIASYNVLFLKEQFGILSSLTKRAVTWGIPLTNSPNLLYDTLNTVIKKFKNDFIFLEIRPLYPLNNEERNTFQKLNFFIEQHYTIYNNLNTNFLELYHSGRKKNIRRAQKNKLLSFKELDSPEALNNSGNLIINLYKKLKLPCPNIVFFNSIKDYPSIKTFGVFYKEQMVACRIVLTYGNTIYDWYAAASDQGKTFFANDYIVHEIFNWGQKNGFSHFDFGGAGKSNQNYGVRDYKLKFGGNLVEIGRVLYINKPLLYKIGKIGFKTMKLLRGK